jgi:DNA-binding NarL/FixJ family response regulator
MPKLVLVSGDLMVASRIEGAARKCGLNMSTAVGHAVAEGDCRVVLVDLRTPGLELPTLIANVRQLAPQPAVVAFGPHVHEESLAQARNAGCDLVVSRGQLERDAESILARFS